MVLGPLPIAKRIVSVPAVALAALIASRSVQLRALQTPSSVSALELTVNVAAGSAAVTAKQRKPASIRAGRIHRSLAQPSHQGAPFAGAPSDAGWSAQSIGRDAGRRTSCVSVACNSCFSPTRNGLTYSQTVS